MSEPFDAFVKRVCPDYADIILGEQRALLARAEAAEEREKALREEMRRIAVKYGEESKLRAWVPAKAILDALVSRSNTERGRA